MTAALGAGGCGTTGRGWVVGRVTDEEALGGGGG